MARLRRGLPREKLRLLSLPGVRIAVLNAREPRFEAPSRKPR